jgi:flagellar hook-associated protein 3 FlgL
MIRLQELAVESGNDALSAGDRERYTKEASMIKKELFEVANQTDSQGNSIFGGISGKDKAFLMTTKGDVSYSGSALRREVQVSPSLYVTQNFSGQDLFENIGSGTSKFKIFEMVDEFISSLKVDLNSGNSSNLLSDGTSVDIVFPSSGAEAKIEFMLNNGASQNKISKTIYGNDYSTIVTEINNLTGSTGVSASVVSGNRIRLQGSVDSLSLSDFTTSNFDRTASNIGVIKDIATSTVVEKIGESRLQNGTISTKITEAFEHFATARAEVGSFSRRAQETEASSQDILITLEENISEIKEADLASLLTQIEFLMTNKEAAQATFTRITSKSLFDFLG